MATKSEIVINLDDVIRAGGVEQALHAWCEESDDTSSGVVGPAFSTSGPGSGWSIQHDESDYAQRAIQEGALYYLDASDGRVVAAEEVADDEQDEDGQWPLDTFGGMDGCRYRMGDWSDDSVVCLVCPDAEEAIEHPRETAAMANAVIEHHRAKSDTAEWHRLIAAIRTAAEALEDIDLDSLQTNAAA